MIPDLLSQYASVRRWSERIAEPLSPEDCVVQSMPDTSPIRWHLAHTTWFFETFVLKRQQGYEVFDPAFEFLFNSYYNAVGEQFPRSQRGLMTRPSLFQVLDYRQHVDRALRDLLESGQLEASEADLIVLGLQHEQQHQELMLTDLKHLLSLNPLFPAYRNLPLKRGRFPGTPSRPFAEIVGGGLVEVGYQGNGFCFDNELPRHPVFLHPFRLQENLVTCGEYLEFMQAGGYSNPEFWLSLGWSAVCENGWTSPLYWYSRGSGWEIFTTSGRMPLDPDWPVCHVSYFEADAFARWKGKRLPTEFEWEAACQSTRPTGEEEPAAPFLDNLLQAELAVHPTAPGQGMWGSVWEWTSSSYQPYPGFRPAAGAVGEYNGKFMCNQQVLRGGSVATISDHIRSSYRNFFAPETRWQFSGIRLAEFV
ncbi:MAG: ergothioneine biosynthesis protein EgtB [Planctomycetota bacterium]|nr:ergothioneine biosynthesis protein EgtB [Planctomycetota bacterium]